MFIPFAGARRRLPSRQPLEFVALDAKRIDPVEHAL
jgi:hypothetical protein